MNQYSYIDFKFEQGNGKLSAAAVQTRPSHPLLPLEFPAVVVALASGKTWSLSVATSSS